MTQGTDMDREQFRKQVTQRYVASKALDGASVDEIAEGMVNPVEQMKYLAERPSKLTPSDSPSTGNVVFAWIVFVVLITLALFAGLINLLSH
ncbi:MAG: hypothetical protein K2X81_28980 [Candidatus Obscuribacterales bacterium]|nr:hypothetical protein [Candidatus Obscuribacterales bacterium]